MDCNNSATSLGKMTHTMATTSFRTPTYCSVCQKLLVGMVKQGIQCSRCRLVCHKKCEASLPPDCKAGVDKNLHIQALWLKELKPTITEAVGAPETASVFKGLEIVRLFVEQKKLSTNEAEAAIHKFLESGILTLYQESENDLGDVDIDTCNIMTTKFLFVPGNWHLFQKTRFQKPVFCDICSGMLWGLGKQGYKCKGCQCITHYHCAYKASTTCDKRKKATKMNEYHGGHESEHNFQITTFTSPAYCNICRSLLYGVKNQGSRCSICGICKHSACTLADKGCKPTHMLHNSKEEADRLSLCHFVEGNFRSKQSCIICRKPVSQSSGLSGFRCTWCHRGIHSGCKESNPFHKCTYGPFASLIIRPYEVYEKNKDDDSETSLMYSSDMKTVPLVVFINKKSGGQVGEKIIRSMSRWLNPLQIFDLANGGPGPGLKSLEDVDQFNVLACGGDGTVGWVLSALDKMDFTNKRRPSVGVLPLGTGNDLARVLGMGGGYDGESMRSVLQRILDSETCLMDRWQLNIGETISTLKPAFQLNNYFSLGIDAKIALGFHEAREKNPNKFKSRTTNKMYYAKLGAGEMFSGCKNLHQKIKLTVDGVEIILPSIEGLTILNLPSYAGGSDLWNKRAEKKHTDDSNIENEVEVEVRNISLLGAPTNCFVSQSIDDGYLEIVGFKSSLHIGNIKAHLSSAMRIAQARHIRLEILQENSIPAQIDGEPWLQDACIIDISFLNRVPMLSR